MSSRVRLHEGKQFEADKRNFLCSHDALFSDLSEASGHEPQQPHPAASAHPSPQGPPASPSGEAAAASAADAATAMKDISPGGDEPVSALETETAAFPSCEFVVHIARAVDPLVGELFVCPYTLEAFCLNRIMALPLHFVIEHFPSPSPHPDLTPPQKTLWGPLASWGAPPLPAAIDPKTGCTLSGRRLVEALRDSCPQPGSRGGAPGGPSSFPTGGPRPTGPPSGGNGEGAAASQPDNGSTGDLLCIGSCDPKRAAAVEKATQKATIELVQRAVQAALHFYMWRDDATFYGFTRPLFQNTLGFGYGRYYCWLMRRRICGAYVAGESPRVAPEELRAPFPLPAGQEGPRETVTMEELLVIDNLNRALRVAEQLLHDRPFLGGAKADAVDAAVFAHLAVLFSVPLPDRQELQGVLSSREGLFQYCYRVQRKYDVWPGGASFLFGVSSLSAVATGEGPLRVHSWRRRRPAVCAYDDEAETKGPKDLGQVLWWVGAAVCCAAILLVAGSTPLRVRRNSSRSSSRPPRAGRQPAGGAAGPRS